MTGRTVAEKILSRSSGRDVTAGDLVIVQLSRVMVHDSVIDAVMSGMRELGKEQVWDTARVCVFVDHAAPAPTPVVADSHRVLREWVRAQGIATFYDAGEGVCHQIMVEEGYCEPGTVIVGSDSHSNSYGAVGAFGAGMGATDVAVALAMGRTWMRVPESLKVTFHGTLRRGVTPKDAIMRVVREVGTDGARYACVEFHGAGSLPQGDRITLAGMTTEMGAKAGVIVGTPEAPEWLYPDPGAHYVREVEIDLSTLEPQIAIPPRVDQVSDISEASGIPVDVVFLGSCTNGRLVDMQQAARILPGRRISTRVRLERRQVDLDFAHVAHAGIRIEPLRRLWGPDDDTGLRAHLGRHAGERDAVALRQRARAVELDARVARAVGADLADDAHDRVLRGDATAQGAVERHFE